MVDPHRAIREERSLLEAPREWLVENGLGGYASATIAGAITRRHHGFLIAAQPAPLGRIADGARARAEGDEVRTVIAGYHWFTDWGRDTMISPRRTHPGDRSGDRGTLDPAHLRSLRATD